MLAGDLLKTALACALCRLLLAPDLGRLAVLYAGYPPLRAKRLNTPVR